MKDDVSDVLNGIGCLKPYQAAPKKVAYMLKESFKKKLERPKEHQILA